jgi:Sulfotransferase family
VTVATRRRPGVARTSLKLCEHPVFIVGSPRSGTTALAWSLARHPAFWSCGETQLLIDLFGDGRLESNYRRRTAPDGSWLHEAAVRREMFLAYVGAGVNALITNRSRGLRWIDKTPGYTLMVDTVADLFPGAQFIHLLRDGRRVVHSMVNFAKHESRARYRNMRERWMTDFRAACRTWSDHVEAARRFEAERPERCLTVVSEELLRDSDLGFQCIFEYLGEPPDEASATAFRTHRMHSSFVPDPRNGEPNAAEVAKLLGPSPWEQWTAKRRAMFLEEAGQTMLECALATSEELRG